MSKLRRQEVRFRHPTRGHWLQSITRTVYDVGETEFDQTGKVKVSYSWWYVKKPKKSKRNFWEVTWYIGPVQGGAQ